MSAPSSIVCPACKKRFKGKPELVGKKIKCPDCQEPFVVPATAPASPPPLPPPLPAEKPKAASAEVEAPKDDAAYGVGRIDTAPRCPNCAKEMLSAEAVICVHCGYNTLTRVHGETKKLVAISAEQHFVYLLPALIAAAVFVVCIILLVAESTLMVQWLSGTSGGWMVHESVRMWHTIGQLGFLWGLGLFAFNTLVLAPKPPDVEKDSRPNKK